MIIHQKQLATFSVPQLHKYIRALELENKARNNQRQSLQKQIQMLMNDKRNLERKLEAMGKYVDSHETNYQNCQKQNQILHRQIENLNWIVKQQKHTVQDLQIKNKSFVHRYRTIIYQVQTIFQNFLPQQKPSSEKTKKNPRQCDHNHNMSPNTPTYSLQQFHENQQTNPVQIENHLKQTIVHKLQLLNKQHQKYQRQAIRNLFKDFSIKQFYKFMEFIKTDGVRMFKDMIRKIEEQGNIIEEIRKENKRLVQGVMGSINQEEANYGGNQYQNNTIHNNMNYNWNTNSITSTSRTNSSQNNNNMYSQHIK